jgi:hypothetical protein
VSPHTCPMGHRTWEDLWGGGDKTRCAHLGLQVWPQRAPGLRTVLGLRVPHFRTLLFEVWAVAAPRTSNYGFWDSLEGYWTRGRVGLDSERNRTAIREAFRPRLCFVAPKRTCTLLLILISVSNRTMGLGLGTRRCVVAAPAIGSESASEAVSWIVCSAVAANGVHGPCEWYDDSRLALRASWSSGWLVAPNGLHCKSTLCTNALVYSCTARSDGLSAHR